MVEDIIKFINQFLSWFLLSNILLLLNNAAKVAVTSKMLFGIQTERKNVNYV